MTDDQLHDWRETLSAMLPRLDWFMPEGFRQDFSPESLDALEAVLLEHFPPHSTPAADTGLADSAMGYLGEALLRVTGGCWGWDDDPGSPSADLPLIHPDVALGLQPIAPMELMLASRRAGTGVEFRRAHASLGTVVADYQASHPGWTPTKEFTPGVDVIDPASRSQHEWLTAWLAARAAAFPAWAAACGGPDRWDFSVESIDALERLMVQRFATVEEFSEPENHEFVDGAAWYLGETVRRTAPGVSWRYYPLPPEYEDARAYFADTGNSWVGKPFVEAHPGGETADPRAQLYVAVLHRALGGVRKRLAAFW